MNKDDLTGAVAEATSLSKAEAAEVVGAVFDTIVDALRSGDEVRLTGFGNFSAVRRGARVGRNPRTGERISVPASQVPKFRAGKGLKDAVNG